MIDILVSKTIKVKWNSHNKRSFVKLGYAFTKYGDEFDVDVNNAPKYSRELILLKCDLCGELFYRSIERYTATKGKILDMDVCEDCSYKKSRMACLHKYGVENIFEDSEYIKSKNMEKNGGKFHTQTEEFKSKYLYGENNASWIDGRSLNEDKRPTPKEKVWRNAVYHRDSYTCKICGDSNGGNLNAHHILPYNNHKEVRFDVDNGITMCVDCHKKFHKIYGYIHCDRNSILDFAKQTEKCNDYP